jgi:hypothetical protein
LFRKESDKNGLKKWQYSLSGMDYQNAKIYKVVNDVDDKVFIGSTCSTLAKRKNEIHLDLKRRPNLPISKHLNTLEWNSVEIVLIEEFPCANKDQLTKRLRHWIDELKPELNKKLPGSSKSESQSRYKQSEKGLEAVDKYQKSEKGQQAKRRYWAKQNEKLSLDKEAQLEKELQEFCANH